jgi:DnaJ-class molecular chaperone
MLDGHEHKFTREITERFDCEECSGTGEDQDADPHLADIRFAACYACGGEGGEDVAFDAACETCGASASAVAMVHGP